jgi:hypothetical protein
MRWQVFTNKVRGISAGASAKPLATLLQTLNHFDSLIRRNLPPALKHFLALRTGFRDTGRLGLSFSTTTDMEDRTHLVPNHQGRNILPNLPLFSRLLRFAHQGERLAIKDKAAGFAASYIQLLTDVLHLRNVLLDSLDKSTVERLERGAEVFINILGPGGYEFTVAFFAIAAVGAVIVPLGKS